MTLKELQEKAVKQQKAARHGILRPIFSAYEKAKDIIEKHNCEEHQDSDFIVVDFKSRKVFWLSSILAVEICRGDYSCVDDMTNDDEEYSSKVITEFEMPKRECFLLNDAEIDKVMFLLGTEIRVIVHFSHEYKDNLEYLWDVMHGDYLYLLQACYSASYKGIDKENCLLHFSGNFFEE